ncbi:MAG: MFS transporter [Bryobacterales bacterium]|nr:MFS transporter [Bryobacteraceae bacterium]MDW8131421.1 MFS transporter [Bryobacterales bacterium]
MRPRPGIARSSLYFVVLLGLVSLLADATYEGARSVSGPYLALLGAGAAAVGFVAGLGEMAGYALRLLSGLIADRTRRYWAIAIGGYLVNLAAVPLLALAGSWRVAALLIVAERAGKAMRTPARDAMLSHAAANLGRGWAFGLHEALDQLGAVAGPALVAWTLSAHGSYRRAFLLLGIPAALAIATLAMARALWPHPRELEGKSPPPATDGLPPLFWLAVGGAALWAAGYADFALIAYHLQGEQLFDGPSIAILYAAAMGWDGLAALWLGRLYDRIGLRLISFVALAAAPCALLVFTGNKAASLAGLALWATGMGAQESVLRAAVAELAPGERRASAYGIFHAAYGVSWFAGSALMGLLYGVSCGALAGFSVSMLLGAAWLFGLASRRHQRSGNQP